MKHLSTIIITLLLACAGPAQAQNSIDKLMEKFSALGNVKYSSVVKRNNQTKDVERVINVLHLKDNSNTEFVNAFQQETNRSRSATATMQNGQKTTILRQENNGRQSVYILKYQAEPYNKHGGKVTIITKYRQ